MKTVYLIIISIIMSYSTALSKDLPVEVIDTHNGKTFIYKVCIDGKKYLISQKEYNISIVQVMDRCPMHGHSSPAICKNQEE